MDAVVLLLLAFGAIGAWSGWALATALFYPASYEAVHPPGPRRWRLPFAVAFALIGLGLGFVMLACLGA